MLFVGSLVGAALLILALVALGKGDRVGWYYLIGSVLGFVLAFAPGRRLRDKLQSPDNSGAS